MNGILQLNGNLAIQIPTGDRRGETLIVLDGKQIEVTGNPTELIQKLCEELEIRFASAIRERAKKLRVNARSLQADADIIEESLVPARRNPDED